MSFIGRLFWNPDERRIRALWRLLVHLVAMALIGVLASLMLLPTMSKLAGEGGLPSLFGAGITALVIGLASWLCARVIDKRRFDDLGFHLDGRWWLDVGAGAGLGVILMGGIFLVELAAGWITIEDTCVGAPEGQPFVMALALALMLFVFVGFYEELLSRGYHLRNLAEGLHGGPVKPQAALVLATMLSATMFGLMHASNPGASALSTINVALAGCLLAIGPILTGELGFAIGLHLSWNFCQGNLFGFPVSGTDAGPRVFAVIQGGNPLITGGEFGPEAGLIGVAAMILGGGLTVLWVRLTRGEVHLKRTLVEPGDPPGPLGL